MNNLLIKLSTILMSGVVIWMFIEVVMFFVTLQPLSDTTLAIVKLTWVLVPPLLWCARKYILSEVREFLKEG